MANPFSTDDFEDDLSLIASKIQSRLSRNSEKLEGPLLKKASETWAEFLAHEERMQATPSRRPGSAAQRANPFLTGTESPLRRRQAVRKSTPVLDEEAIEEKFEEDHQEEPVGTASKAEKGRNATTQRHGQRPKFPLRIQTERDDDLEDLEELMRENEALHEKANKAYEYHLQQALKADRTMKQTLATSLKLLAQRHLEDSH